MGQGDKLNRNSGIGSCQHVLFLQKAEWESSIAFMPGMNRRSLFVEDRGTPAAARRCLTQMGKPAMLGIDVRI